MAGTIAYIVTRGAFSDYCIDAVFSSEALAKDWIAKNVIVTGSPDDFSIEEWGIDAEAKVEVVSVWSCAIMLDSGEIVEVSPEPKQEVRLPFRGGVKQSIVSDPIYGGHKVTRVESGVSHKHCLKFAAEQRQAYLRARKDAT